MKIVFTFILSSLIAASAWASVMQSGTGVPANTVGNNGDLYHRTDVPSIYGPKANGTWPAAYSVILGKGCTTAYHIDLSCSGYGVGPTYGTTDPNPLFGIDAGAMGATPDGTVHTAAQALAKYGTINAWLSAIGYPTNRVYYIDPVNGNDSNFSTNACSAANPCQHYDAVGMALHDGLGGTVIYRASTSSGMGVCHFGGPCYNPMASSSSSPLVVMAYPGEMVVFNGPNSLVQDSNALGGGQNVTFDGFHLVGTTGYGTVGGGIGTVNQTLRNSEIANWDIAFEPSSGAENLLVENNVFHDIMEHAIYLVTADQDPATSIYSANLYDCSTPWNPVTYGGVVPPNAYNNSILRNNLIYNSGSGGFEGIHFNGNICGGAISGNIIWGGGGTGIGLQTGVENLTVSNNVIFSNSSAAITLSVYGCDNDESPATASQIGTTCNTIYDAGTIYYPNMLNNISIVNNTIWTGENAPCADGCEPPSYGIIVDDYSQGTPGERWIKDITIKNNLIVTYATGSSYSGGETNPAFVWYPNSYPDTYTIQNNLLYNMAPGNNSSDVMFTSSVADCTGAHSPYWACTGVGTANTDAAGYGSASANSTSPGDHSFSQFQSYNTASNSNNLWANPRFNNVSVNYAPASPYLLDFHPVVGSPAIGAGTATGAPSTDITGTARNNPPSIGAYEYPLNVSSQTTSPTTPTGLTATAVSASQINLSWTASTETGGTISGYNIYRNGTQVGTNTTTSYSDTGLAASTSYSYTVSAYDASGNNSSQSAATSATTQAAVQANLPVINTFVAGNSTITAGGSTTLFWSVTGTPTPSVSINNNLGPQSGTSVSVSPTTTTTYILTATNSAGSATQQVTVTVNSSGSPTSPGPIAFVNAAAATTDGLTASVSLNLTAGNLLVVFVTTNGNGSGCPTITVSDNASPANTYTPIGSLVNQKYDCSGAFYAKNITGGSGINISATAGAGATAIDAMQFSGLDPSNPLDTDANASAATSPISSGAFSTAAANELVVAGVSSFYPTTFSTGTTNGVAMTIPTGAQALSASNSAMSIAGEYLVSNSSLSSATSSMSISGTVLAGINVAAFKAAAGSTPPANSPSVPTGLTATVVSSSQVDLSWTASTESGGTVTGYNIYRNGTQIGTSTTASYSDSGLTASTSYSYTVSAYDTAGNTSAQSTSTSATTLAVISTGTGTPTLNTWTEITGTTGWTAEAYGYDKAEYIASHDLSCIWGGYKQWTTSEDNNGLVCYSYKENRWSIMQANGFWHGSHEPGAGHSVSLFSYMTDKDAIAFMSDGSGPESPEKYNGHWWWFDVGGLSGEDHSFSPRPWLGALGPLVEMLTYDQFDKKLIMYDQTGKMEVCDPNTNVCSFPTISGTAPATTLVSPNMVYDSANHTMYIANGGQSNVYTFQCSSNACTTATGAELTVTCSGPDCTNGAPPARMAAGMAYSSADNIMMMIGGIQNYTSGSLGFDDTWVFNPTTNAWTELSPANLYPSSRTEFTSDRLIYDSGDNVFLYTALNGYNPTMYAFAYSAPQNYGQVSNTYVPTAGSLNRFSPTASAQSWAFDPSIAASNGNIYLGWIEAGADKDVSSYGQNFHPFYQSLSNGTWTYYPGDAAIDPELDGSTVTSKSQTAFVGGQLWEAHEKGNNGSGVIDAAYSNYWNGASWVGGLVGCFYTSCTVGGYLHQAAESLIAVGNTPTLAVLEWNGAEYSPEGYIYVAQYNGTSWNALGGMLNINGAGTGTQAWSASLATDGTNPAACWSEQVVTNRNNNTVTPQIQCAQWNGSSWVRMGSTSLNQNSSSWASDPAMTYANGKFYVAWTERTTGGNSQLFTAQWNNGAWTTIGTGALNINASTGWAAHPSLSTDGKNIYLAWEEQLALNQVSQVYVKEFNGASWSQIGGVLNEDPVNGSAEGVRLAVVNSQPVAVWGELTYENLRQIYAKQWNGTAWGALTGGPVDTTPPTVPIGLAATAVSSSRINLSWTASTDSVGVAGYNIYRNGTEVGTSATVSYSDTGLTASTSYSYTVSAFDAAGNVSAQSTSTSATTQASSSTISYGDLNGAANGLVTIYDAELVAQYAVGLVTLTPTQVQEAMVSSATETSPTVYDAYLIAEYAVGLITKFPVQS